MGMSRTLGASPAGLSEGGDTYVQKLKVTHSGTSDIGELLNSTQEMSATGVKMYCKKVRFNTVRTCPSTIRVCCSTVMCSSTDDACYRST